MITISTLLLSFGVSADSFAASISKGLKQAKPSTFISICIASIFSTMEMMFLYIGHILGNAASPLVAKLDHWIAFFILLILGIKMILHCSKKQTPNTTNLTLHSLIFTAIGTSIDSISIGISTAFMNIPTLPFILTTGFLIFTLSFIGSRVVAHLIGYKLRNYAEKIGGSILIGIAFTT